MGERFRMPCHFGGMGVLIWIKLDGLNHFPPPKIAIINKICIFANEITTKNTTYRKKKIKDK